jgi:uncharacterized membrane protein
MSPSLGVAIMMNNYFHDVATALLVASGFLIWVIVKRYDVTTKDTDTTEYFLRIYRSAINFAKFSLIWIIIGGVPRTLFYKEFEWANAVGKSQVPALIVKHILAFTFLGTGVFIWLKINNRVKNIKRRHAEALHHSVKR